MLRKQLVIFITLCTCFLQTLSQAPASFANSVEATNVSVIDEVYGPNDYPAKATAISVGEAVYGTVTSTTDIDFYRFDVETLAFIQLQVNSQMADLDIALFDQELVYIGEGTTTGNQDCITAYLKPGTYFVRVYAPEKAKDAEYTLTVSQVDLEVQDNNEPNNIANEATLCEVNGETVVGAVYGPDDVDWFCFDAQKAGIYNLELNTDQALYIQVLQDQSKPIFAGLVDKSLPIRVTTGSYQIVVTDSGQPAQYELRVVYTNFNDVDSYESNDAIDDVNDTIEGGCSKLGFGAAEEQYTIYTNLDCVNDVDSFLLTLERPVKLTVGATGPREMWIKIYKVKQKGNLKLLREESVILGDLTGVKDEQELADYVLTKGQYFLEIGGVVSSLNYATSPDYWVSFVATNAKNPKPPKDNKLIAQLSCDGAPDWSQSEVRVGWDEYVVILPEEPNEEGQLSLENLSDIFTTTQLARLKIRVKKPGYFVDWQPVDFDDNGVATVNMHLQAGDLDEETPGIDGQDLQMMSSFLGTDHDGADFNGDGSVNIFDLVLVTHNWNQGLKL